MAKIFRSLLAKNVVIPTGEIPNYVKWARTCRIVTFVLFALFAVVIPLSLEIPKTLFDPIMEALSACGFIAVAASLKLTMRLRWVDRVRVALASGDATYFKFCMEPPYTGLEELTDAEVEEFIAQAKKTSAYKASTYFETEVRAIHARTGNHTAASKKL